MVVVKILTTLIFWILLQVEIFVVSLISYPALLLSNQGRWLIYSLDRWSIRLLFLICFIRVKVTGLDNLPRSGRIVFLANKPNLIATFALIAFFPLYIRYVANERMFHFPLLGRIIRSMGCIEAADGKERSMGFASEIIKALRNKEAVLFYPLNIRRSDGQVTPFKDVELKVAKMCGAQIVPIAVKGSLNIMPQGSAIIAPGRIEIAVGRPGSTIQEFNAFFRSELHGN